MPCHHNLEAYLTAYVEKTGIADDPKGHLFRTTTIWARCRHDWIERLKHRAAKANLVDRIDARVTRAESMQLDGLDSRVDIILAFAVVHEMMDAPAARILKRLQELRQLDNGVEDPYFHLVDGGISDNPHT